MSALAVTPAQIRAIHAIKTRTRLDDGAYRAMLSAYDAASSKDLTREDADRFLERLREVPGAAKSPQATAALGPYGKKLRAMWIALYNLGAVADRSDKALHAFVEGQTGIAHTRFLTSARDAEKAIEALKAWLVRMGVAFPKSSGVQRLDVLAMKREILRAQWRRLTAAGAVRPFGDPADCDGLVEYVSTKIHGGSRRLGSLEDASLGADDLDKVARFLGAWIRRAVRG